MYYDPDKKIQYFVINRPHTQWEWCYSVKQLKPLLDTKLDHQLLKKVYFSLGGYLDSMISSMTGKDIIDFSCTVGTSTILVFESTTVELAFHAEGMLNYTFYSSDALQIKSVFGCPPDDIYVNNNYFFDAANHDISIDYENIPFSSVSVMGIDTYPFELEGFDDVLAGQAEQNNDLPREIDIILDNGNELHIIGDDIEYYFITFRAKGFVKGRYTSQW